VEEVSARRRPGILGFCGLFSQKLILLDEDANQGLKNRIATGGLKKVLKT
jgi:hypothetical protein